MTSEEAEQLIAEIDNSPGEFSKNKITYYSLAIIEKIIKGFVSKSSENDTKPETEWLDYVENLHNGLIDCKEQIKAIHMFLDTCFCPSGYLMGDAMWRKNDK